MARQNPDPYLVLGVSPTATQAQITHAYRTRLRAHHPDTRRQPPKPPTTTSGKSWPLTTCCAIPPAAPTTTAPPHHYRTTHAGRHPLSIRRRPRPDPDHLPNHQHPHARCLIATLAGRPGAPAPITARFVQNNWLTTRIN